VAQNRVEAATVEPQRAHVGPEPGAVSRRPQCGQNGNTLLARLPQNGQRIASRAGAAAGGATTRLPDAAAAARSAADLPMGLPQSIQNCAPGSLSRPQ